MKAFSSTRDQHSGLDVYFSAGYHAASAMIEAAGTVVDHFSYKGFNLRLLLRPIEGGRWDATSCYGYGGPWVEGNEVVDSEQTRTALDEWARARGVVCTFVRFHPILDNRSLGRGVFEIVDLSETVAWPIHAGAELLPGMKKKHRQYVRKAEREGLTTEIVDEPDDLRGLAELYRESMDRLDAENYYRFGDDYYRSLIDADDVHLMLVNVKAVDEVVTSLLCLVGVEYLHAHLLGTNDVGRAQKANYAAYAAAARWGQERGLKIFHLGGGYGERASDLLEWKRGFCPTAPSRRFSIGKAVHDPSYYRQLTGSDSTAGFFPPWRERGTPEGQISTL